MGRRVINPWTWQDQFGFVQALEVTGSERALFCAGQTSSDADGNPVHAGDMRAQLGQPSTISRPSCARRASSCLRSCV